MCSTTLVQTNDWSLWVDEFYTPIVETVSGSLTATCGSRANYSEPHFPEYTGISLYYMYIYTTSAVYNHASPNGEVVDSGRQAGSASMLSYVAAIVGASSCTYSEIHGIASLKAGVTVLMTTSRVYVDRPAPRNAQASGSLPTSKSSAKPGNTRVGVLASSTFASAPKTTDNVSGDENKTL